MAIKPFQGIASEWYVPQSEKEEVEDENGNITYVDPDDATRFKLKPLDSVQLDYAMDGSTYTEKGELIDLSPRGKMAALKYGLTDWENFDVKFSQTNFNKIPWVIRQELAIKLVTMSMVTEEESTNLK